MYQTEGSLQKLRLNFERNNIVAKLIWTWKHKVVYMGKDKYENEELLKYGFPEEMWSSIFYYINLHNAYCFRLLTFQKLDGLNMIEWSYITGGFFSLQDIWFHVDKLSSAHVFGS